MNPDWPRNEEEWQEALSAYLDGELPTEQQEIVDRALKEDSLRAKQHAEMLTLKGRMQAWEIEPDTQGKQELLNRLLAGALRGQLEECAPGREPRRKRILSRIPSFAMGVMVGAVATLLFINTVGTGRTVPATPESGPSATHVVDSLDVSMRQADALLREIAANQLKSEVLLHLQERDWNAADRVYRKMEAEYADTESLRGLRGLESTQVLQRYRVTRRRGDGHA